MAQPLGRKPKDGFILNPLKKYPRNKDCFCGSRKRSKVCCLPTLPDALPERDANIAAAYMEAFHADQARRR